MIFQDNFSGSRCQVCYRTSFTSKRSRTRNNPKVLSIENQTLFRPLSGLTFLAFTGRGSSFSYKLPRNQHGVFPRACLRRISSLGPFAGPVPQRRVLFLVDLKRKRHRRWRPRVACHASLASKCHQENFTHLQRIERCQGGIPQLMADNLPARRWREQSRGAHNCF